MHCYKYLQIYLNIMFLDKFLLFIPTSNFEYRFWLSWKVVKNYLGCFCREPFILQYSHDTCNLR